MDTLIIMLKNVLIFVLLAVPGYLLVKGKSLSQKESGTLSKLLTNIGMPFLIFSSTLKLELSGSFALRLIICGVFCVLFTTAFFFLCALFVRFDKEDKRQRMMRFCMAFANNGFIGIPLARAVFGEDSPVMAYLIILNIITNVLMFSLGTSLLSGDKKSLDLKKVFLNPVLLAFLAGIAVNLTTVTKFVPEIQTYCTHFSGIVTPLSMVILGMKLAAIPMGRLFASWRMYYVSAVRLVLFPALGVALGLLLRQIPALGLDNSFVLALFMGFAMPTAGLASAFADRYQGDTDSAAVFTLGTTILSVATIPVLYMLLNIL